MELFSITSDAGNGSVTINGLTGDWGYTPDENYYGSDQFTVTVTDDLGGVTEQDISLYVIDDGYDINGFDINGFNRKGYDISGYDAWGYDSNGFNADGEQEATGAEFSYKLLDGNGEVLNHLAVIGETVGENVYGGVDYANEYRLDITAKSLGNRYSLETVDITIEFDAEAFEDIFASDIQISSNLGVAGLLRLIILKAQYVLQPVV